MPNIRIKDIPTTASATSSTDFIGIDGSANGTRKLNAFSPTFGGNLTVSGTTGVTATDLTLGTSGPSVKSTLSARAPRQGLVFDGTAGATVANVPAFGTGDFTFAAWIYPTSISTGQYLIGGAIAAGNFNPAINATTGVLTVYNGVSYTPSPNQSVTVGKWQLVVFRRVSGVLYASVNAGAEGSVACAENFATVTSEIGALDGTGFFNGAIIPLIYNRALSASEVVALYEAGAPAGADYNSASNTALNNSTFLNIDFTTFTSASSTGFTATNTSGAFKYAKSAGVFSIATGQRFRVRYTLSGTFTNLRVELAEAGVAGKSAFATLSAGTNEVTLVATGATANGVLQIYSNGSADNFTLSNVTIDRPGLLLAPDAAQAGGGLVWYDTSGNAANITLPASGVSWNVPSSRVLGGNWNATGTFGIGTTSTLGTLNVATPNLTYGTVYLNGATTTADFMRLKSTGADGVFGIESSGGGTILTGSTANSTVLYSVGATALHLGTSGTTRATLTSGGNFLIGTTIDGGQKLQVNGIAVASSSGTEQRSWNVSNTAGSAEFGVFTNGIGYIGTTTADNFEIYTQSVKALTVDTSQNATFAGQARLQSTSPQLVFGAGSTAINQIGFLYTSAGQYVGIAGNRNPNTGVFANTAGTHAGIDMDTGSAGSNITFRTASTANTLGTIALTLDKDQNATFAGNVTVSSGKALKLGNAYTAGAPTATGYVTIQDSAGNTYKVLVGT